MTEFFTSVPSKIAYEGPESDNPLAFRWYDADRVVGDRTMAEHLRFAVAYWHSFNWDGFDIFGAGTLDRPWLTSLAHPLDLARVKMEAAFEFFDNSVFPTTASTMSTLHLLARRSANTATTSTKLLTWPPNTWSAPASSCSGNRQPLFTSSIPGRGIDQP